MLNDADGFSYTWDEAGSGLSPEPPVLPTTPNDRAHRLDTMSFFSRGRFERQTGNDDEFVSDMSSNEAWIWYGHLRMNSLGTFSASQDPGQGTISTAIPGE